jgi:hypothetical protein
MSRIDPIRQLRRLRRPDSANPDAPDAPEEVRSNLPVPVGAARTLPGSKPPAEGGAGFAAHLMGQDGQRRGLRAGPAVIDIAKASYNKVEYSGSHDRRARKGRAAKTEV